MNSKKFDKQENYNKIVPMYKNPCRVYLSIFFIAVFLCPAASADSRTSSNNERGENKNLKAIELLTGFGRAKLRGKENYRLIPFIAAFDFDIKPLIQKTGLNLPGLAEFQLEPFVSIVSEPSANIEAGNAFIFKIGLLPESFNLQPYLKAGGGMLYMSQHTREQSTQFNFFELAGAGLHYYLNKNIGITADYRFRHVSNAGMKHPNRGINTRFFLMGVNYRF